MPAAPKVNAMDKHLPKPTPDTHVIEPPTQREQPLNYYDRLQWVQGMARTLQGSPIPGAETDQQANLARLTVIEDLLELMVGTCDLEVWCGKPDDPMRRGRPMARGLADE